MVGRTPRVVTLTTTPQNLRGTVPNPTRSIYFYYSGGNNVWFAKSVAAVTGPSPGNSFPAVPGMTFSLPDSTGDVWAMTDAGTQDLYIWDMEA